MFTEYRHCYIPKLSQNCYNYQKVLDVWVSSVCTCTLYEFKNGMHEQVVSRIGMCVHKHCRLNNPPTPLRVVCLMQAKVNPLMCLSYGEHWGDACQPKGRTWNDNREGDRERERGKDKRIMGRVKAEEEEDVPSERNPPSRRFPLTIFSVLLRLMSFLLLRRDVSSMSMMRIRGMVPPPMRRMVKRTMTMVVVPINWRFSMGSRPKWRLRA